MASEKYTRELDAPGYRERVMNAIHGLGVKDTELRDQFVSDTDNCPLDELCASRLNALREYLAVAVQERDGMAERLARLERTVDDLRKALEETTEEAEDNRNDSLALARMARRLGEKVGMDKEQLENWLEEEKQKQPSGGSTPGSGPDTP